jgi:DNA-binding GntR family transcriptional regulator
MAEHETSSKLINILRNGSQRYFKADTLAASALREAIINGILAPGQEVDEELIAKHLNISRMPVRQALAILEAEGLVKRPYRKGAVITELTRAEIEELYHIRAYLEGLAIQRAVPNYSKEHISKLKDCLEELKKSDEDAYSYLELNNKFHAMLYEPCEWDRLLHLIVQLRNNAARYMVLAHEFIIKNASSRVGHDKILRICEEGDPQAAQAIIRKHILAAMGSLLQSFDQTNTEKASS